MIIYCDIDNTITMSDVADYSLAIPDKKKIDIMNSLYELGHIIIYWTARGVGSGIDYRELTESQLKEWGCRYNELRLDKPVYDILIEDRSINQVFENLGLNNE